jgi:hypothetical protein
MDNSGLSGQQFVPLILKLSFGGAISPGKDPGVSISAPTTVTARLYDGNTLLGTYTTSIGPPSLPQLRAFGFWVSPTDAHADIYPQVNFATILNGTINGRIEL